MGAGLYRAAVRELDLRADETVQLVPARAFDMGAKGWWSADFHLHRPVDQARTLLAAEDLNLGVFFTMWNKRNQWEGKPLPASPSAAASTIPCTFPLGLVSGRLRSPWAST